MCSSFSFNRFKSNLIKILFTFTIIIYKRLDTTIYLRNKALSQENIFVHNTIAIVAAYSITLIILK